MLDKCSTSQAVCQPRFTFFLFHFEILTHQAVFELSLAHTGLELFNLLASTLKFLTDLEMRGLRWDN